MFSSKLKPHPIHADKTDWGPFFQPEAPAVRIWDSERVGLACRRLSVDEVKMSFVKQTHPADTGLCVVCKSSLENLFFQL